MERKLPRPAGTPSNLKWDIPPRHSRTNGNPAETTTHHRTGLPQAGSPHSRGWRKSYSGFTLVELIVVITILVILGTIAFTSLGGYSGSARDSSRVSDLANLSKSLDIAHVKTGSYPAPDNTFSITYSGGVLWNQGTVGDMVMNSLSAGGVKMNRKPTDPLTPTKEYTYSSLVYGNAYQIKTDYEGESVVFNSFKSPHPNPLPKGEGTTASFFSLLPLGEGSGMRAVHTEGIFIPQAQAASGNPTLTYIKGNYNGMAAKTQTGNLVYVLAVPSLFVNSSTGTVVLPTATATGFYLHGQTNSGGIAFTTKLVFSSSSGSLPATDSERILFASGIANAYSGTSFATNTTIASYISALSSNNTGTLASLGGSFVAANLGGMAGVTNSTPTIISTTFSLSATSVTAGTSVTITDTCTTHPTSYTSSNTSVATIASVTTINTSTAGTTTITPVGGNCTDSAGKTLTVTAAPIPAYSSTNSTAAYIAGQQFTYNGVTVTVTSAWVGTGSSAYAGCDTPDIVIWASGYNPQIWAACNVGATTSAGFATVPTQSPNPSVDSATLPANRVASVQGNYYQWGRNDNVTSGTWAWANVTYGGTLTSPANTTGNTTFYGGDATYGDWKWGGSTTPVGWNTANGGDNQWPCATGYHIPTDDGTAGTDWPRASQLIVSTMSPTGANYDIIRSTLKLPLSGYRDLNNGQYYNQGLNGYYWSSSPNSSYSHIADFYSGGGLIANINLRGGGFSVRCTKD